jgi:hypothetical protein
VFTFVQEELEPFKVLFGLSFKESTHPVTALTPEPALFVAFELA